MVEGAAAGSKIDVSYYSSLAVREVKRIPRTLLGPRANEGGVNVVSSWR
jgi:hypothetical protein